MTTVDLYAVLGLKKTATAAQVRKAYRKLAAKYHPDQNPGEDVVAQYHAVCEAYEVLSDPERRRRYDETGDASRPPPPDQELLSVIAPAVIRVFQECHTGQTTIPGWFGESKSDPKRTDLAARVRDLLKPDLAKIEDHITSLKKAKKLLAEIAGRFSVDSGPNLLDELVRSQARGVESDLAAAEQRAGVLKRAMDYLKTVKYRVDGKSLKPEPVRELPGFIGLITNG